MREWQWSLMGLRARIARAGRIRHADEKEFRIPSNSSAPFDFLGLQLCAVAAYRLLPIDSPKARLSRGSIPLMLSSRRRSPHTASPPVGTHGSRTDVARCRHPRTSLRSPDRKDGGRQLAPPAGRSRPLYRPRLFFTGSRAYRSAYPQAMVHPTHRERSMADWRRIPPSRRPSKNTANHHIRPSRDRGETEPGLAILWPKLTTLRCGQGLGYSENEGGPKA
jgi:hypothetical protein